MRILVTGVKGQLGYDVVNEANKRGIETVGVDIVNTIIEFRDNYWYTDS